MTIAELKQALDSAPDESTVMVRSATGEQCPVSAVHIGAGGDAAGMVMFECGPVNSDEAAESEDDGSMDSMVDAMAQKSGALKPKAKPAVAAVVDADEDGE